MPTPSSLSRQHLHHLARRGAQQRLTELHAEIVAIIKHFPDLRRHPGVDLSSEPAAAIDRKPRRRRRRRGKLSAAGRAAIAAAQKARWAKIKRAKPAGKRSKMSAAARKAVSVRMKKYWAERRKAKGKVA